MDDTWLQLGGLAIRSPVTAGTNLVLAGQCFFYFHVLRTEAEERPRLWAGFFLMMSLATFAGVFKHGFRHELSDTAYFYVLWASSLTSGVSTYYAQRATIASHARGAPRRWLGSLIRAQLVLYLAANLALGPEMMLIVVNTGIGLLPVIAAEAVAFRRGQRAAGWVAGGISVSIGTGVVYLVELSAGRWLNHIDIAHLLMGVSFFLMVRGAGPLPSLPATQQ